MILCVRESIPQYPRHPGDIGDIGDIFRKSLKLLDFLNVHDGDISGDIFRDGDLSPPTLPAPTEVFPKWKRLEDP